jgi:hypothetical protein
MRKLVIEIMGPISDRSNNNFNELEELKLKNESLYRKIDELDRTIKHDLNLKPSLDMLKRRLTQIDQD